MSVNVSAIRSREDLRAALDRLNEIFMVESDAPEAEEREVLAALVETYERQHFPMGHDAAELPLYEYIKQKGIKPSDLVSAIGAKTRVSDVLHGRRRLSLAMIRRLHSTLGIPYAVLMSEAREKTVEPVATVSREADGHLQTSYVRELGPKEIV